MRSDPLEWRRASINPQNPESQFTAKYHTTVQIEYNEGGKITEMLKDKNWIIKKTADTTNLDSIEIASKLDQKMLTNLESQEAT